jgi:OmpA-OmpF porin, OOP family
MKISIKTIFTLFSIFFSLNSNAQFLDKLVKKAEKATERAIERKVEQKATKSTNEAMDGVLNNKNTSKTTSSESSKSSKNKTISSSGSDFVSGNKILFEENFGRDAIGDFPVKWFTNSSGEIVIFDGDSKKWLQISDKGSFSPINISKLPENFTFEFDVTTTYKFSNYSTPLNIVFTEKTSKTDNVWNTVFKRKEAMIFNIHPSNSLSATGRSEVFVISEKKEIMKNKVDIPTFSNSNNTMRVQVWRQKNRFRMYIDGKKYWDLPMAFADENYNQIIFFIGTYKKPVDKFFISNLKLAEAGSDKRHQLIETGSFSTNEILFDTNKATIKSSSATILNDLGKALNENSDIKISITGHTDSDGDEKANQKLSEQRAESVKNYLSKNFDISNSRMKAFGSGEAENIAGNNTESEKMQNRRVAFKVIN